MSRTITIAAVQMDANPAPTEERLARAERLVVEAAEKEAALVVLPELFNVGYTYADTNYRWAEPVDGPTVQWTKRTAARLGVHLAGSLMLLDEDEVYNALLLVAPDGRVWRYDKIYPWAWERAFFRDGCDITVADTDLGRIGMLVCWDAGHPGLWRRYAGRVDLMVVSSCPPDITDPVYGFPDGRTVSLNELGEAIKGAIRPGRRVFAEMLQEQTAWLGVPAVNTVGCGQIATPIPNGRALLLAMAPAAPWLLQYLPQGDRMTLTCPMMPGCRVVDARGRVVAELAQEQGESLVVGPVGLAEERPMPSGRQPVPGMPWLTYVLSDAVLPWLSIPLYRRGLRRAYGPGMAPVDPAARSRAAVLSVSVVLSLLVGCLVGRWSRRRQW